MPGINPALTLTEKEKIFCEEYIADFNATHAAIRAEYPAATAEAAAHQLMQRPEIEARINRLLYERELRRRITVEQVLLELAKIAYAEAEDADEPTELIIPTARPDETDLSPEKRDLKRLEKDTLSYIAKVGKERDKAPKPTPASTYKLVHTNQYTGRTTIVQFSLSAKIAALKLLGRHLGLFFALAKPAIKAPNIIFPLDRDVVKNESGQYQIL